MSSYPITAILPIRNNLNELEQHIQSVNEWAGSVSQVIVVDSSTDGSMDYVRDMLAASNAEFYSVPPGLYEAWNFAIKKSTAKYCYFATVGDSISPKGLKHLFEVADEYELDIVISPPEMVGSDGELSGDRWPIHHLCSSLRGDLHLPDAAEAVRWLTSFLPFTILGSSAANLYRTRLLQEHNFPTEYGHNCDAALGAMVASFAKIAVSGKECSRFVTHGQGRAITASEQAETAKRFFALLQTIRSKSSHHLAQEFLFSEALIEQRISILEWTAALEPLCSVLDEQKGYIDILERNNAILAQENETLSKLSAGIPLPMIKRGHLHSALRFLKSRVLGIRKDLENKGR